MTNWAIRSLNITQLVTAGLNCGGIMGDNMRLDGGPIAPFSLLKPKVQPAANWDPGACRAALVWLEPWVDLDNRQIAYETNEFRTLE